MTAAGAWPALAAASAADAAAQVPLWMGDAGRQLPAGAVARHHLDRLARWPEALRVSDQGVLLHLPAAERTAFLAEANAALHREGAIIGWRGETYGLLALPADGAPPEPARDTLATLERAAARFWGSATYGAHCNGYLADAGGRPTHLWIARRAPTKPTDPGLLDNLIGGGVPHGQSPAAAVRREGWEEAGLRPAQLAGLRPGRVLRVLRDLPEGLQREWLSVYDLALPPGFVPVNQDGEVAALHCLPVAEALARAEAGEMTVDATLAMLDFALRHRLLPPGRAEGLAAGLAPLLCGTASLAD